MADKLIELFAEVLGLPEDALPDDTSPDNTPKWTSRAAMQLVARIEEAFEVRLSTREIMRMRTIGICREVLQNKGVTGV